MHMFKRAALQWHPLMTAKAQGIMCVVAPVQLIQDRVVPHPTAPDQQSPLLKGRQDSVDRRYRVSGLSGALLQSLIYLYGAERLPGPQKHLVYVLALPGPFDPGRILLSFHMLPAFLCHIPLYPQGNSPARIPPTTPIP